MKHLFVLGEDTASLKKSWPELYSNDVVADYFYNDLTYAASGSGYKITGELELNLCTQICGKVIWLSTLHLAIEQEKMTITMTPWFVDIEEVKVRKPVQLDWNHARSERVNEWKREHSGNKLDTHDFQSNFQATRTYENRRRKTEYPAESDGFKTTIQIELGQCDFCSESYQFDFQWEVHDIFASFHCFKPNDYFGQFVQPGWKMSRKIFLSDILNYADKNLNVEKKHLPLTSLDTSSFFFD